MFPPPKKRKPATMAASAMAARIKNDRKAFLQERLILNSTLHSV
jgi:hypothetical protein